MGFQDSIERIVLQAEHGIAYTGINESGKIIGIGGVMLMWEGVGAGWVITSPLFPRYKVWVHRVIRDIVCEAIKEFKLHRVESLILESHEVSCRWAERLGFKKEGLLNSYDRDRNNYYMYARIE